MPPHFFAIATMGCRAFRTRFLGVTNSCYKSFVFSKRPKKLKQMLQSLTRNNATDQPDLLEKIKIVRKFIWLFYLINSLKSTGN